MWCIGTVWYDYDSDYNCDYGMVWYGMFVHVYYTHYFTQLVGRFEANKLEPLSSPEVFGHAVPDAQPIGHPGSSSCTKTSA